MKHTHTPWKCNSPDRWGKAGAGVQEMKPEPGSAAAAAAAEMRSCEVKQMRNEGY